MCQYGGDMRAPDTASSDRKENDESFGSFISFSFSQEVGAP